MRKFILFTFVIGVLSLLLSSVPVYATSGVWSNSGSVLYYVDGAVSVGTTTGYSNRFAIRQNSGYDWQTFIQWANGISTDSQYYIHASSDGASLEFATLDGTNPSQPHWGVLKIVRNGDIRMGYDADQVNLSVNGTITTRQVTVTASGYPDYVFNKDYKLKSLSEVEQYIKDNGHLPEVTPAKEAEANGIDIGKSQEEILKKVEELTLYTIQQDKKIATLEARINSLVK